MKSSVPESLATESADDPADGGTANNGTDAEPGGYQAGDEFEEEVAPGIQLNSTHDEEDHGIDVASVSIGRGGVGQNVGKVRRTG